VTVDPPLTFDCPMVVALYRWIEETVQPVAQEIFGSPVARIIGSSYACRTVYNLPNGHLSQHALANALDLPMFVLADGRKIDVTHGWGQTQRDLIAATKREDPKKKCRCGRAARIGLGRLVWRPSSLTRYVNGRTASREETFPTPIGRSDDRPK
jgi:Extensin-like protein C-terminus